MKYNTFITAVVVLAAGLLAGCDTGNPLPSRDTLPGQIRLEMAHVEDARVDIAGYTVSGDPPLLAFHGVELHEGPVPVQAEVPFEVTVHTLGRTDFVPKPSVVSLSRTEASIAVFDEQQIAGTVHFVLAYWPRTDTIVFPTEGEAEVVIKGVMVGGPTGGIHSHEMRFPVIVQAAP